MNSKFLIEAIFLLILTILFQYFLIEALNSGDELLTAYSDVTASNSSQDAIDAALEEHNSSAITFMNNMEVTIYLSVIAFFYTIRILLELLFAAKSRKTYKFITFTNLCDFSFS